jgi:hypothetical protein
MNGFCINIFPHIGKSQFPVKKVINFFAKNLNKNDFLYMDRYYCTVDIFLNLKKLDIRAIVTIMQNRKNLSKQYLSNINLQRYESTIFTYDNSIKILIWKDKKMYIQ